MKICSIEDCGGSTFGRGWCSLHYARWRRWGDPLKVGKVGGWGVTRFSPEHKCLIDGCKAQKKPWYKKWSGYLCRRHYQFWRQHGGVGETLPRTRTGNACLVPGCTDKGRVRGYCPRHYEQVRTHGELGKKEAVASPLKAIMEERGVTRQRAHQILNGDKHRARQILTGAVKRGKVIRPARCERCKKKAERIEAHHEDYAKPLDVAWLCPPCHSIVHPHLPQVTYAFKAAS